MAARRLDAESEIAKPAPPTALSGHARVEISLTASGRVVGWAAAGGKGQNGSHAELAASHRQAA